MTLKKGDVVKVHYTGKFKDGSVFDSSDGKDPLQFEIGKGMVIVGFENGVKEMNEGDEKDVVIKPEEGYGKIDPNMKKDFPKDQFKGQELKIGMVFSFNKDNRKFMGKIVEIKDDTVVIDFNHLLAGKELHFHLKLVKIEKKA